VRNGLLDMLQNDPQTAARMKAAEADVKAGRTPPTAAAEQVLGPLRLRLGGDAGKTGSET
jgi:LAO/AO transport system kinase